jgi:hypothetical protein
MQIRCPPNTLGNFSQHVLYEFMNAYCAKFLGKLDHKVGSQNWFGGISSEHLSKCKREKII